MSYIVGVGPGDQHLRVIRSDSAELRLEVAQPSLLTRLLRPLLIVIGLLVLVSLGSLALMARERPLRDLWPLTLQFLLIAAAVAYFCFVLRRQLPPRWQVRLNDAEIVAEPAGLRRPGRARRRARAEFVDLRLVVLDGRRWSLRTLDDQGRLAPLLGFPGLRTEELGPWRAALGLLRERLATATGEAIPSRRPPSPASVDLPAPGLRDAVILVASLLGLFSVPLLIYAIVGSATEAGKMALAFLPICVAVAVGLAAFAAVVGRRRVVVGHDLLRLDLFAWRRRAVQVAATEVQGVRLCRAPTHGKEFRQPPEKWPPRLVIDLGGRREGEAILVTAVAAVREYREADFAPAVRAIRGALGLPAST